MKMDMAAVLGVMVIEGYQPLLRKSISTKLAQLASATKIEEGEFPTGPLFVNMIERLITDMVGEYTYLVLSFMFIYPTDGLGLARRTLRVPRGSADSGRQSDGSARMPLPPRPAGWHTSYGQSSSFCLACIAGKAGKACYWVAGVIKQT